MTVDSLNSALSGLRAAQRQIGLISNNVANATTPGFTRKILPQSDFVVNGQSIGVQTNLIRRQVNASLQFDLYNQTSLASASQVQLSYLREIQLFHGDPNDDRALPGLLRQIQDDFVSLADNPTNSEFLSLAVSNAQSFVWRVNDLSDLYTRLRNEAQTEIQDSVAKVNGLLQQIKQTNDLIVRNTNTGQDTATLEDQRDIAILELSKELDISYFNTGDGRVYIQAQNGDILVDQTARTLSFNPTTLGVSSTYPASAEGIFFDDPSTSTPRDIDITGQISGGRLGGLLELRDETLPRYQAELDELAQKLSQRFDEQGLRLFTDPTGEVPPNVAPPTATGYVGYAQSFRVNDAVVANPNLLRLGTEGETIPSGSARIIDRINDYVFGSTRGEQVVGDVDISSATDLFTLLSLTTSATVTGTKNIQALATLDADSDIEPGIQDTFSIRIGAGVATNITINAGDTATDLVNTINTAFPGLASLSATGRLVLQSTQNIVVADVTLGSDGLTALGLNAGTTTAQNPSFTVQLDDGLITTIPITSTDTSAQLLTKLNAIAGVNAALNSSGFLEITTDHGAQIKLVDGLGGPANALGLSKSSIAHTAFRTDNLGGGAALSSQILGADNLASYAQRVISVQASEASNITDRFNAEETYRSTVEEQLSNESGVNLDEEIGNLVSLQRIYGANARVISTSIDLLNDLLDAI